MPLPENPISGGYTLTNIARLHDGWTCPNCYKDHKSWLQNETIDCSCGARVKLTINYEPVCHAECIDPDAGEE
jgi:hypothetical protein